MRIIYPLLNLTMKRIALFLVALALPVLSLSAQLVINELMANNVSFMYNTQSADHSDWIEILNKGPYAVDLGECSLSDDPGSPRKWDFPAGTYISPGQFLFIWADGRVDLTSGFHASFKLDAQGETLILTRHDGALLDSLSFGRQPEDVSFGIGAGGQPVYFSSPTPGLGNDYSSAFAIATGVRFDPEPGIYSGTVQVQLACSYQDAVIRYTLDGSEPGEGSDVYTEPLSISSNTVVRARIWADGYQAGWTETGTYLINVPAGLPVFSLVTDPVNLWDDMTGIYVEGTNGIIGYCSETPMNYNQDWERPVSLEYMEGNGPRILDMDGGIKIHGGCSRGAPNKSLVVFARSRYGPDAIEYPFFKETDLDEYKSLTFRNSGNDSWYTMIRDAAIQASVKDAMDIDGQAYEPVLLYLNGEFWGLYNLRERINEHWVSRHYGIPEDEIDLLKSNWAVMSGSREGYDEMLTYMASHDLSVQQYYDHVASQIDIEEYINYLITEMFYANRDWPGNNVKYWRRNTGDGKWRWVLYDMDFTCGLYEFDPGIDMFSFVTTNDETITWPNPPWATFLPRKLLENEGFRQRFIAQYIMQLNTTFRPERVIAVIDSLREGIREVMPGHIARWYAPGSMEDWDRNIGELEEFARQRPGLVRENMRQFFGLGEEIPVEIAPDSGGTVVLNDFVLPDTGFEGRFFSGTPLNMRAYPDPGNSFVRWEVTPVVAIDTELIPMQSEWRFWDKGWYPGVGWNIMGYNDGLWETGEAELGYGDGDESTVLSFGADPDNKYLSYYFRHEIELTEPVHFDELRIRIKVDDGAVIYVNGQEILRVNMPAGESETWTTAERVIGGDAESTFFEYATGPVQMNAGTNVVAVEVHQAGPQSSDISFDMILSGLSYNEGETEYFENPELDLETAQGIAVRTVYEVNTEIPPLVINEFMASNRGAYTDETGGEPDWIEIMNTGGRDINMAGCYMTDDLDNPLKWQIPFSDPVKTTVTAGGFTVLLADGNPGEGANHLGFKLDAGGEDIGLSAVLNGEFYRIDAIRYTAQQTNFSYGRYPDGSSDWSFMDQFTPGSGNMLTAIAQTGEHPLHLEVFPNPAADFTRIRFTDVSANREGLFELSISDLSGRILLRQQVEVTGPQDEIRLDLSAVPSGMYILVIRTGDERHTFRLVRQ